MSAISKDDRSARRAAFAAPDLDRCPEALESDEAAKRRRRYAGAACCRRPAYVLAALYLLAAACSDESPKDGEDMGTAPAADLASGEKLSGQCTVDKRFCADDRIRLCASDGRTSILQEDCTAQSVVQPFKCAACSNGALVCKSPVKLASGTVSGVLTASYEYDGSACDGGWTVNTESMNGKAFFQDLKSVGGVGFVKMVSIVVGDISRLKSGVNYPLHGNGDDVLAPGEVTASDADRACINKWIGPANSPSAGSMVVTYAGLSKGSNWTIAITGHLLCDSTTWEPFSYNATGVFTR